MLILSEGGDVSAVRARVGDYGVPIFIFEGCDSVMSVGKVFSDFSDVFVDDFGAVPCGALCDGEFLRVEFIGGEFVLFGDVVSGHAFWRRGDVFDFYMPFMDEESYCDFCGEHEGRHVFS